MGNLLILIKMFISIEFLVLSIATMIMITGILGCLQRGILGHFMLFISLANLIMYTLVSMDPASMLAIFALGILYLTGYEI